LHIYIGFNICINRKQKRTITVHNLYEPEDLDAPGTTTGSPHRHIHLALPLTVLHMPYTSYLDTAQHHGIAGSLHVARDVRLYLIRTWGSVSKNKKKENAYICCL
jgi:hypothetical protein